MPSLAHLLRASSTSGVPFDARAACAIASQVCTQLERPHGSVAPSTILVDWDGSVTLERSGHATGSALPYMAPERLAGGEPDARSDVHAVAMVLLEMITGRPARRAPGLTFAGDFPVELVELVERSSSPDPIRRHSSPREMAAWLALAEEECGGAMTRQDLAGWLTGRFGQPAPVARAVSVVTGRRWRVGAAAGLLALLGAGAAVLARPLLEGRLHAPAPAAAMMGDGATAEPTTASAASSSMSVSPASSMPFEPMVDAPSSVVRGGAAATKDAAPASAAPEADEASDADQARRARRKRARAARRASADAASDDAAMKAEAAAPPASCPISQAPSNTMGPAASDAMAPAASDAMAPAASDAMAPATKGPPRRTSDERPAGK